jgi:hypothetical protein
MAVNKSEIERFFEERREIRSIALDTQCHIFETTNEEKNYNPLNPQYIGVYLSNYYSNKINKKLRSELLK